ncbi:serine/threonine-protein kinase [Singulisphaera sp. Ch08]|uniref:Serine/threonine-protein kinase n=1 Tax=Singulisphaera sp. Ch08 TaxID=3120278 RepID=A0AAU7C8D4_9BACT
MKTCETLPLANRSTATKSRGAVGDRDSVISLATEQVEAMVAAWRRGERTPVEQILARHPELKDEAVVWLIFEELCLREDVGIPLDSAEILQRFPQWRTELAMLLDCRQMMEAKSVASEIPCAGEELAGFRLLAELGRGLFGVVFLALETALGDRPVVVKVTARGRGEHLSLARLQHRNIVPLHSAQQLPDRELQILCMPYLGGSTLAQVLDLLGNREPRQRTGRHLMEALEQLQANLPIRLPGQGPFARHLAESTYADAICWIGACLADGLQYAHERSLIHLDVKPSNVLLACDGQPMLLDFHLARGPIDPHGPEPAWMGGTPHYMAPEQREALDSVNHHRPILAAVDGRADIYSLGKLLNEALGDPVPEDGFRGWRRPANRCVSRGLADILQKCLASDPQARYSNAALLAADLRQHLNDLPLVGVPNRSLAERWRKARRHRPLAISPGLMILMTALIAIGAASLFGLAYWQRIQAIEVALADGRAHLDRREYANATSVLKQGLTLARPLPGTGLSQRRLMDELALAQRGEMTSELRRLVELVRFRYGVDPPPAHEARSLIHRGRDVWRVRDTLLLRPVAGGHDPEVERGIRADLLDFVLFWVDLTVRSAPPESRSEARREARMVLDEASRRLGPSPALDRDRAAYDHDSDNDDRLRVSRSIPQSAWEHYDLGRSFLRSGELTDAASQFQAGLDLRPQDFWLNFYDGLCAYRLGRFDDSVNAFRVCVALAPESAECFHNRALALSSLDRNEQAIVDYSRALRLDPALTGAALNRGILQYRAGRLEAAATDLKQALVTAVDRSHRGVIHYNLAIVDLASQNRSSALRNLAAASSFGHAEARRLQTSLHRGP